LSRRVDGKLDNQKIKIQTIFLVGIPGPLAYVHGPSSARLLRIRRGQIFKQEWK